MRVAPQRNAIRKKDTLHYTMTCAGIARIHREKICNFCHTSQWLPVHHGLD